MGSSRLAVVADDRRRLKGHSFIVIEGSLTGKRPGWIETRNELWENASSKGFRTNQCY